MNQRTLDRLKANPHYKISAKNLNVDEGDEEKAEPMIAFGKPAIHNIARPIHPVGLKKQNVAKE